jgi:hypothetical protein
MHFKSVLWFRMDLMRICIRLFILMQFRIQGAKLMLIHADPDPVSDSGQTFMAQKV